MAEISFLRMLTATKVHSNFAVAFSTLVALRLLLSFTDLSNILKHNQQLSSPLTSFLQCMHLFLRIFTTKHKFLLVQEGIYLFNHDIDPYSGGSFRHVRVLLADTSARLPTFCVLVTSLVVLFRDDPTQFKKISFNSLDCKRCRRCMGPGPDLESQTKREKQLTRCPRSDFVSWLLEPCFVLILFLCRYLLNPYIFLPSLALSTSSFENTLLLISLMFASQGNYLPHLI